MCRLSRILRRPQLGLQEISDVSSVPVGWPRALNPKTLKRLRAKGVLRSLIL